MLERWQPGATLDVHDEMMKVTLAIAAKAFFNADVEGAASDVGRSLEVALDHFNWWGKSGFMIPLWVPFRANRELAAAKRRMDALVYGIIAERRRTGEDPGDLLSMLLKRT
jgi:cytochrome P450